MKFSYFFSEALFFQTNTGKGINMQNMLLSKQVRLFLNENKDHEFFLPPKDKPSTNPSNPGITTTPPHPKY